MKRYVALVIITVAISTMGYAQTSLRDSINVTDNMIKLHPDSVQLYLVKAALYLKIYEWEGAVTACTDALYKDSECMDALYYRAYANNNLRRYTLAKNDYETLIRLAPRNKEARLGLIYTLTCLKKHKDALDNANVLIELFPDSGEAFAARAGVEEDMGAYELALYDLDEAIRMAPVDSGFVLAKAEILIQLNRKQEARATLQAAIQRGVPQDTLASTMARCR
ncbi:MAG: tetratricopeptide repeat protein [Prevotella sp.]